MPILTQNGTRPDVDPARRSPVPERQGGATARLMAGDPGLAAAAASAAAILGGALVLLGWALDVDALKRIGAGPVAMMPNTAVVILLAGTALGLLRGERSGGAPGVRVHVGRACAGVVAALGLLTLAEYACGWDLGIDHLLLREASPAVGTSAPGRMSPHSALAALCLGSSLWLLSVGSRRAVCFAQSLLLAMALVALLGLVGYAYGVPTFVRIAPHTPMSLPSAMLFLVLAAGALGACPRGGLMDRITSDGPGGVMARRLLPPVIGIPLVLGWIRLAGQRAGYYDTEFGLSWFVLANVVLLTTLVWAYAAPLNRQDAERRQAEERVRTLNEELERRVQERTAQLEDANRQLADEVLERRRAEEELREHTCLTELTAETGAALIRAATMREMLGHCAEALVLHLGAAFARIWTLNEADDVLELQASAGMYTHLDGPHSRVPVGRFKIGLIAQERRPHLTNDVCNDPRVGDRDWARREGMVGFAGYPLIVDDRLIGVLAIFSRQPLTPFALKAMGVQADALALVIRRKQAEEALERARDELLEANVQLENASRAKDRFLASMSHELRTPLNAILGFTGTLLMKLPGPLTAEQEKQLRTVQGSARHLLALINDLLDLVKIESGKVELKLEPLSCRGVLEEVAAALRPLAEAKGLAFEVAAPDPELVVRTDRRALTQILINLAGNAIKFTERGRVRLEVGQVRDEGRSVTAIHVADTGIGIGPEDRDRLFRAFEQVGPAEATRPEGTGLGLHLSRKLAELLGGRIECQSDFGVGSTFTLVLNEA